MHTFWRQEAHSVLSLSLSPPPHLNHKKRIKYKFEGKKIETSRFVWFFFFYLRNITYSFPVFI